ncbi:CPBP family intramembrane metalloprotease [Labilibacter sediminis]|nr:CPBP family intramembrane metalloprotease [Labilibacter sediminis]
MIRGITASAFILIYASIAVIGHTVFTYFFYKRELSNKSIIGIKLLAVILYGIISVAIIKVLQVDFAFARIHSDQFNWMAISVFTLSPIILFVNYRLSKKPTHNKAYPQIKVTYWKSTFLIGNTLLWLLYLIAYEFLFRGILLFVGIKQWGIIISVIINTILYAIAHLPKGKFETIGAIPLGILFCFISIKTNSFYTACFLHCLIAISNDLFCIKAKSLTRYKNVAE